MSSPEIPEVRVQIADPEAYRKQVEFDAQKIGGLISEAIATFVAKSEAGLQSRVSASIESLVEALEERRIKHQQEMFNRFVRRTDELTAAALKFSDKPPAKPGWYWWRDRTNKDANISRVDYYTPSSPNQKSELAVILEGGKIDYLDKYKDCTEWCGPLVPPE